MTAKQRRDAEKERERQMEEEKEKEKKKKEKEKKEKEREAAASKKMIVTHADDKVIRLRKEKARDLSDKDESES